MSRTGTGSAQEAPAWLSEVPLAHRGLHGDGLVENSCSAFDAAVDAGYGVELDVQLSADGVPVVFHDAALERLTGKEQRVSGLDAAELSALRLLNSQEGVPTLAEALSVLGDAPVMVELKTTRLRPGTLETAVAAILSDHPGPACIASFNPVPLRWFRRNHPAVLRVLTAMATNGSGPRARLTRRLAELRDLPSVAPAAVSYHLHSLPHPAVDAWRGDGGVVLTWTVEDDDDLSKAREVADNIIFENIRP